MMTQWTNGGRNSFHGLWKTTRTLELERELYSNSGGHRWTDLFIGGQQTLQCRRIEPESSYIGWI